MIEFIKKAITSVDGIKDFKFYDDYMANKEGGEINYPCAILEPIEAVRYERNGAYIRDKMNIILTIADIAPFDYDGQTLYNINHRCAELMIQVLQNLQVRTTFDKEVDVNTLVPMGDEFLCGAMINLQVTAKQPRCAPNPTIKE